MSIIAQQLDEALNNLDPMRAQALESEVREVIAKVQAKPESEFLSAEFFAATAGAFTNEKFERPPQGDFPKRESW